MTSVVVIEQWTWISTSRGRPVLSHFVPSDQRWTRYRVEADSAKDTEKDLASVDGLRDRAGVFADLEEAESG
jgi:hypothetical protein